MKQAVAGDGPAARAWAPGRVNLIGEHTDYTGGLALPMAIQLGIEVQARAIPNSISLRSDAESDPCEIDLPIGAPASTGWSRYVSAVARQVGATTGMVGTVRSTLPPGAGLSSSAALEIATFLALASLQSESAAALAPLPSALDIARLCQRAEQDATGVPCGLLDQLAILAGTAGNAVLIDASLPTTQLVQFPASIAVWVIHSGVSRQLETSEYGLRRAQCEAAEQIIGPLRQADATTVEAMSDPLLRRRARHVVTENQRVCDFVAELSSSRPDPHALGQLLGASHRSLADNFEVSLPVLDDLVAKLVAGRGVFGARLTGAGFGGCLVAICDSDATLPKLPGVGPAWRVEACEGASVQLVSPTDGEAGRPSSPETRPR